MKRFFLVLSLVLLGSMAWAQASETVVPKSDVKFTVDEERFIEKFKAETLPQWKTQLNTDTGAQIDVELDWNTFAGDQASMDYLFSVSSGQGVINTVSTICGDPVGKKRLTAVVKKIVLKHDRASKDLTPKAELAGGVLTVTYNYGLNNVNSDFQKAVEKLI